MKTANFAFGYEHNQQWSLLEGSHLFANAEISQAQHTLVIGSYTVHAWIA